MSKKEINKKDNDKKIVTISCTPILETSSSLEFEIYLVKGKKEEKKKKSRKKMS